VKDFKEQHSQKHKFFWDGDVVSCSCKYFEFRGILCRYVLTIFFHEDFFQISIRYLPLCWCCDEFQRPVEVNVMLSEVGHKGKGQSIDNEENIV